ncbi:aminodeoxychorismate/anthranilate synthase component II [Candidatus Sumerlaeota bacterium]|nr:aminodeoxychorismate/anthranilate synthase component II [Candidatus Sumerlaeota bacterium]
MIFVLDNYDSFTYNLVQYMGELGAGMFVRRNDEISVAEVEALKPDKVVVSPGPCTPDDAGISMELIGALGPKVPTLGVCLGHQSLGQVFGGKVIRAPYLMHGKTSQIHHNGAGIFAGVSNPFEATRYHSLIVERESLPDCLEVTAWTDDDIIMGLRHKEHAIFGLQFHPESILTGEGKNILKNFLEL